jgi:hypothetical protein
VRRVRASFVLISVAASTALCGCADGYLFRNDHRISIDSPGSFATVHQPLTVRWTARDFTAPHDGSFAVFFDLAPPPPGQTLGDIPPLQRRLVRVVDTTSVEAPAFTHDSSTTGPLQDHHQVTVVLLDGQGRRISETAGYVEFDVST